MTQSLCETNSKRRVLICEDQGITIMQLRRMLERNGYDVIAEVATAQAAIEVALSCPLDLILMDVRLIGTMNGLEAAYQILAHHFVPIVMVTASTEAEVIQQALEAGVCGFITKPVISDHLLSALETILASSPCQQRIAEVQASFNMFSNFTVAVVGEQAQTSNV